MSATTSAKSQRAHQGPATLAVTYPSIHSTTSIKKKLDLISPWQIIWEPATIRLSKTPHVPPIAVS